MTTQTQTAVIDQLSKHRTVRFFKDEPVSDDVVHTILNAARQSPTSSNRQTYSIMVVRNPETKKKLAVLAGNQKHVETCPVFFAFCADLSRLDVACEMHGEKHVKGLESTLVSTVDAALVGMSVNTAVESLGMGAVMIGGMRNHPKQVAELLGFPNGVYVVFGMCIGWPEWDKVPNVKPRLDESVIIHHEQYNTSSPVPQIEAYNQTMADYYGKERNLHESAWSGPLANQLKSPRRENLRSELESLGFVFK